MSFQDSPLATHDSLLNTQHSTSVGSALHGLLLVGNRALARALTRAGVGPRALAAHGQTPAVPYPPVAADFHQALDVHGDVLAEITLHATLLLYDAADLPDVVFGQILHAEVGADP